MEIADNLELRSCNPGIALPQKPAKYIADVAIRKRPAGLAIPLHFAGIGGGN
jgi:hypothetical protein